MIDEAMFKQRLKDARIKGGQQALLDEMHEIEKESIVRVLREVRIYPNMHHDSNECWANAFASGWMIARRIYRAGDSDKVDRMTKEMDAIEALVLGELRGDGGSDD